MVKDTTKTKEISLDEVLVSAVRVTTQTPVTFSNLTKEQFKSRNLGQDIPIMMNYLPSVVTTTDAGAGVGYTGIRVRGSDATRVNVTINGIPYNDSESQGTFWVNMPDFASSTESLQLQRGVGTSTNGAGAFGASLNLLTDNYSKEANGEISNSFGSFNTRKSTVKFSTGLLNEKFELAGRLSSIQSDGYIDRATSDLKGYFLQGTYVNNTTLIKGIVFGGNEKTYQAWNGIDKETLKKNRKFNYSGIYTDEQGNIRFYENEVDNYKQNHYQLHWNEKWNEKWISTLAFHYTYGNGFFENYKEEAKFSNYGLVPINVGGEEINQTDLIRQKWLDNDFYGVTFSTNYKNEAIDFIFGGAWNRYEGAHFGKVIWARYASQSEADDLYYNDFSTKNDRNIFGKINYQFNKTFRLFIDFQVRNVNYKANGVQPELVEDNFTFFNPKAGITYTINDSSNFYLSYAKANREPNRNDYESGNFNPEQLNDFELGWRFNSNKIKFNSNIYYMTYRDQLILTGNLDDVGNPIRSTSEKSYRLGLEIEATLKLKESFFWQANMTWSKNQNIDLTVDGINEGNTTIAYSPSFIGGSIFTYKIKTFQASFLSKFVGEQFMNNIESPEAKLSNYFVSDLNVSYEWQTKSVFKAIVINGLVNNIFDQKYVSNGYMYDIYPYYYPQAEINLLIGLTFLF